MEGFTTVNQLNVLVLAGGVSNERDVSLASGKSVYQALINAGHKVTISDISPSDLSALDMPGIDVVFSVLHGCFGEDGQVQKILEDKKIPFVGSGSAASQLAMDKWKSKQLFEQNNINVTQGVLLSADEYRDASKVEAAESLIDQLGLPVVVKPVCDGSSVGVYLLKTKDEIIDRLENYFDEYGDCLAEKFNCGDEFTVGIVCDQILPIIQIKAAVEFYDYDAKYQRDDTSYLFDIELTDDQKNIMNDAAMRAYQLLGCRDLVRIDFMVEPDCTPQLLEVNTLPGFTDHSLVPKAAQKIGISMPELCDKIVQNAMSRPII